MWWTLDRVIYLYFAVLGYMEAGLPLQGPRGLLMPPYIIWGGPAAHMRQYPMGWFGPMLSIYGHRLRGGALNAFF